MLLATIAILASCEKGIVINTVINRDGTCAQELSFAADSAKLTGGEPVGKDFYALNIDDNWALSWGYKGAATRNNLPITPAEYSNIKKAIKESGYKKGIGDTLLIFAKREFDNVEKMCSSTPLTINGNPLKVEGRLDKKFRWFYTDYTYTETYACIDSLFPWPLEYDFKDNDEASYWFTGSPDIMQGCSPAERKNRLDQMERCAERWLMGNVYSTLCDKINYHSDLLCEPPILTPAMYRQRREEVVRYALDNDVDFLSLDRETTHKIIEKLCYSGTYSLFFEKEYGYIQNFKEEVASEYCRMFSLNAEYNLVMPGRIIDSGNGIDKGGYISYRLTGQRLLPHDYVISATSRCTNIWACALTALLAVGVVLVLAHRKKG